METRRYTGTSAGGSSTRCSPARRITRSGSLTSPFQWDQEKAHASLTSAICSYRRATATAFCAQRSTAQHTHATSRGDEEDEDVVVVQWVVDKKRREGMEKEKEGEEAAAGDSDGWSESSAEQSRAYLWLDADVLVAVVVGEQVESGLFEHLHPVARNDMSFRVAGIKALCPNRQKSTIESSALLVYVCTVYVPYKMKNDRREKKGNA